MLPSDLGGMVSIDAVAAHSDGAVVYATSRMNLDADRYERDLWLAEPEARALTTHGEATLPRLSPDGRVVAFLRRRGEEPAQLAVLDLDTGDEQVLTSLEEGVVDFAWAPGSDELVAQVREVVHAADRPPEERPDRPRLITRYPYRFDEPRWEGTTVDQLWRIPIGGEPFRLTAGDTSCQHPAWSPDGLTVAFLSDRTGRLFGSSATQICTIGADGGDITAHTGLGLFYELSYRPDGVLHAVGLDDEEAWPTPFQVWRLEGTDLVALAPQLDRTVSMGVPQVRWMDEERAPARAVYAIDDRGKHVLVAVAADGTAQVLVDERLAIKDFAVAGDRVVLSASTATAPGYLRDGAGEVLADPNAGLDIGLIEGEYFTVPNDGDEVDAWVYLPPGDGPVPLLLNIHGGPAGQYGFGFFDEFQVYASAGFGVVACNPRGSTGRGEAWMRAVTGDGWGVVDLSDVTAVVEAAVERFARLDGDRLGIMGGSYGGFLTAWTVSHDDRYRSAVVERGLLDWTSFTGTSDIASTFPRNYLGESMPKGHDRLWQASPLSRADQITTPMLIIHSEGDYRCPIGQAEQFFFILMQNGTETAFLRFPGESHELSRKGKPRHRQERFEEIVRWHRAHLA